MKNSETDRQEDKYVKTKFSKQDGGGGMGAEWGKDKSVIKYKIHSFLDQSQFIKYGLHDFRRVTLG